MFIVLVNNLFLDLQRYKERVVCTIPKNDEKRLLTGVDYWFLLAFYTVCLAKSAVLPVLFMNVYEISKALFRI